MLFNNFASFVFKIKMVCIFQKYHIYFSLFLLGLELKMSVEATEAYAVGPLDLILLFSFIGLIVYWFMRKKSEPKSRVNGLIDLQPVNIQNLNNVDVVDSSGFVSKMKKSGNEIFSGFGLEI